MPRFGTRSLSKVHECEDSLQRVLFEAIKHYDFSCIWGFRDQVDQTTVFRDGFSRTQWPNSKHNSSPSRAFDVIPYPQGFKADHKEFYKQATYILRAAVEVGVNIKWAGHWKRRDEGPDLAHFELD